MRYRLRSLMIVLAIGPPVLAYAWLGRKWLPLAICWALFSSFFALWYWMLRKSQANPKMRGEPNYNGLLRAVQNGGAGV